MCNALERGGGPEPRAVRVLAHEQDVPSVTLKCNPGQELVQGISGLNPLMVLTCKLRQTIWEAGGTKGNWRM